MVVTGSVSGCLPVLGLALDDFSECALEPRGHRLLEQREEVTGRRRRRCLRGLGGPVHVMPKERRSFKPETTGSSPAGRISIGSVTFSRDCPLDRLDEHRRLAVVQHDRPVGNNSPVSNAPIFLDFLDAHAGEQVKVELGVHDGELDRPTAKLYGTLGVLRMVDDEDHPDRGVTWVSVGDGTGVGFYVEADRATKVLVNGHGAKISFEDDHYVTVAAVG